VLPDLEGKKCGGVWLDGDGGELQMGC
jgi:hypothetical protein